MSHHTAAIDLVDTGTRLQVHLGVFRPGVLTLACPIDCGKIAITLVRIYRYVNFNMSID